MSRNGGLDKQVAASRHHKPEISTGHPTILRSDMNLSQMLFSHVTPLADYQPKREHKPKPHKMKDGCTWNVTRHEETVEKYRSAWKEGEEWLPTREIEARLGMSKAVSSNTLKKWADEYKIIERRPHGKVYNPCMGYEWRFIK